MGKTFLSFRKMVDDLIVAAVFEVLAGFAWACCSRLRLFVEHAGERILIVVLLPLLPVISATTSPVPLACSCESIANEDDVGQRAATLLCLLFVIGGNHDSSA